ncbi:hypothetical protein AK812_SmicGene6617 [Symbiodinium microadriaticum]|uniref:Uncharacterized protein n=1 Tax=Symbiodinium microadriaticum TaxID=2951 RepID=A0A1Q9EQR8_SYMMI|nr:hypothetical protein AK812_SmicGene6617 [Symbiodinium microadriaticum]
MDMDPQGPEAPEPEDVFQWLQLEHEFFPDKSRKKSVSAAPASEGDEGPASDDEAQENEGDTQEASAAAADEEAPGQDDEGNLKGTTGQEEAPGSVNDEGNKAATDEEEAPGSANDEGNLKAATGRGPARVADKVVARQHYDRRAAAKAQMQPKAKAKASAGRGRGGGRGGRGRGRKSKEEKATPAQDDDGEDDGESADEKNKSQDGKSEKDKSKDGKSEKDKSKDGKSKKGKSKDGKSKKDSGEGATGSGNKGKRKAAAKNPEPDQEDGKSEKESGEDDKSKKGSGEGASGSGKGKRKATKDSEQDGDGGEEKTRIKKIKLAEQKALVRDLPALKYYFVMPYWSRCEVGIMKRENAIDKRQQVFSLNGTSLGLLDDAVTWREILIHAIDYISQVSNKRFTRDIDVLDMFSGYGGAALGEHSKSRWETTASRPPAAGTAGTDTQLQDTLVDTDVSMSPAPAVVNKCTSVDLDRLCAPEDSMGKRGNAVGCVESGSSGTDAAKEFLAKAKARAALAKAVRTSPVDAPSPTEAPTPKKSPSDAVQATPKKSPTDAGLATPKKSPTDAPSATPQKGLTPTTAGKAMAMATPKSCLGYVMG